MGQYTLQPGPLYISQSREPVGTRTAVLDPIEAVLSKMPCSYMLLKPVQVEVQASQVNGSVTMRYVPKNPNAEPIEVKGRDVEEAERLMRSALAETLRRCLVVREGSPHVLEIDEELSDLIEH